LAIKLGLVLFLGIIIIILTGGCGATGEAERVKFNTISLAPLSEMPDYVQAAPPEVQRAYQFAVANPEILKQIPCFCGCNAIGHRNNLDCYVDKFGQVTKFDNHAAY
jgi:hypothetical protein